MDISEEGKAYHVVEDNLLESGYKEPEYSYSSNIRGAEVTEEASFINDLGADSLDVVEFIMEVEKEFDITISDEDATKLVTVGDAVKYIEAHQK